eukprot:c9991_g1_i2.p1 GENE.c9991_g1_i2~~c9991_g1_i2.p1  ORF type:complete len:385 (+),score=100.15 c9991_g1_i2:148-1155(+)
MASDPFESPLQQPSSSDTVPKIQLYDFSMDPDLQGGIESKFTFVVPTYSMDMCKFRLLCHKLIEHGNGNVGEVVAIWVDKRPVHADMLEIRKQFVEARISFRLLRMWDVVEHQKLPGWIAQQVAKLRVSKYIRTKHYIVLDSKNFLVRPLEKSMFQSDKKMFNFKFNTLGELSGVHRRWYEKTHITLKHKWNPNEYVSESVTPFVMHTKAVRRMIFDIERETTLSLDQNILLGNGTEFCFYNVYIRREGLLQQLHDTKSVHGLSRIVWAYKDIDKYIDEQERSPSVFFGVHQWWLSNVPVAERDRVRKRIRRLIGVTPEMRWYSDDQCLRFNPPN